MQRLWDIMQNRHLVAKRIPEMYAQASAQLYCERLKDNDKSCIISTEILFKIHFTCSASLSHHSFLARMYGSIVLFILFKKCQSRQQTEKFIWQLIWYAGTLKSQTYFILDDFHRVINHNVYIYKSYLKVGLHWKRQ